MSTTRQLLARAALGVLVAATPACFGPRVLGAPVRGAAPVSPARAELAAVLLNDGRYSEAAREYGYLVASDSRNYGYRLGLARALAWSRRYRDAEAHLSILAARRPGDETVAGMLRTVRQNITPSAREAARWYAEHRGYMPYRLAFARALVREGRASQALPHYEVLLSSRPSPALLREAVDAYEAADDLEGASAVVERHMSRVPPAPGVLVERARIHARRRDFDAAEADLRRSIALGRTTDAYLLLGDIHRWRGDFDAARNAYSWARSIDRDSRHVAAAFAQLARDERPAPIALSVPGEESGWRVHMDALRDNAGIEYTRGGVRGGFAPGGGFTGSGGVEYRRLHESAAGEVLASHGVAADVRLARTVLHGPLVGSIGARAGLVYHDDEDVMPEAGVVLRGGYNAWLVAVGLSSGPAYPTLLTAASLVPVSRSTGPLREREVTVTGGGPIGAADAALTWRRADLSDGNQRSAFDVSVRYRVAPRLSVLYAGSSLAYAERSDRYWDPDGYLSSVIGLGYAERPIHGMVYGARALFGVARSEESPFLRDPVAADGSTAPRFQLDVGADLGYRAQRWDVAAGFRFARVSEYHRADATLTLSIQP